MHTISLFSLLLLISSSAINTMATPIVIADHRNCVVKCKDTSFTINDELYDVMSSYPDPASNRCIYRARLSYPWKLNPPTVAISTAPCGWTGGDKPNNRNEKFFIKMDEFVGSGYKGNIDPRLYFIAHKHWPNFKHMLETSSLKKYHSMALPPGSLEASNCRKDLDKAKIAYLNMVQNMANRGIVVPGSVSFLDIVWFNDNLSEAHPITIPFWIDRGQDRKIEDILSIARDNFNAKYRAFCSSS
ncbi:hypothetical protein FRC03_003244 [Tulasnella sp. 419]|nr:hypothetical protein FRC03_003244 [Tulasnella sp. 419]